LSRRSLSRILRMSTISPGRSEIRFSTVM
jgi:hypothetical protein